MNHYCFATILLITLHAALRVLVPRPISRSTARWVADEEVSQRLLDREIQWASDAFEVAIARIDAQMFLTRAARAKLRADERSRSHAEF